MKSEFISKYMNLKCESMSNYMKIKTKKTTKLINYEGKPIEIKNYQTFVFFVDFLNQLLPENNR